MYSDPEVIAIVTSLRGFPELHGCVIGYVGDGECRVVDPGDPRAPRSPCVGVIIEVVEGDGEQTEELAEMATSPAGAIGNHSQPEIITNKSRLGRELVGAGISCSLTVVSALGVFASAATEVPTAGASTFLLVASWTGLATGGLQCLNGIVRVGAIWAAPNANTLQRWDSNLTYSMSILIVDAIGISGGVASLPFAVRNLWATLARQRAFLAKGLSFESLRAMNRVGRMKAISEVFEEAARTPEGREALVQAAKQANVGARSMQRAGISVRHAELLRKVISEQTVKRIASSLRDVLGGLAGVGASASPAALTGSASGSVNYLINLVDAGTPAQ
jgi:hypothetical protein